MRELLPHAADEVIHRDRFVLSDAGSRVPLPLRSAGSRDCRRWEGHPALLATLSGHGVTTTTVAETCAAAKRAARALASASTEAKDAALEATARLLGERSR